MDMTNNPIASLVNSTGYVTPVKFDDRHEASSRFDVALSALVAINAKFAALLDDEQFRALICQVSTIGNDRNSSDVAGMDKVIAHLDDAHEAMAKVATIDHTCTRCDGTGEGQLGEAHCRPCRGTGETK